MVRVCVVCAGLPPHYGGAELRAFRYAQRLQSTEGIGAILIGWDRSERRTAGESFPEHVHAVKLRFKEVGGAQTPARFIRWVLHVTEIGVRVGSLLFALRHEFDVVHIINAACWFNLVPIPLVRALNKPVILEMTLLGSDDPLKLNRRSRQPKQQVFPHRPLKYSLFLMADVYVSKSHALSDAYRQAGLPESKLFQIPSGVDTQKFKPPTIQEKLCLRDQLGLNPERTIVLFVGGIEKRKGIHRLLAAWRKVAQNQPGAHLVIVGPIVSGDPSYIQSIHDNVVVWGLTNRVTFVTKLVENVHEYMKAADVFVLPSSREGLSVALLEAMSSGLAIVASDIPEIAYSQIKRDVEGLLVPVGDANRLVQVLTELIGNATARTRLEGAARERVLREFTLKAVTRQYIRLYRDCLKHNRRVVCENGC